MGDALPDDTSGAVQTHVSRLRRLLPPDTLVYGDGGYFLDMADDELDSDQFDRMVTEGIQARHTRPDESIEWFDAALALWRGPPYMEFVDWDVARAEASRLEELWLLANEERFDALLAVGRHEESLADLVSLAAKHPLRDRTRALLMTALYRAGRQPEALQAYEDHRRHLAAELGLDPSPALRDLERSMLDHTLDVPRTRHDVVGSTASILPQPATRLIGRDQLVGELRGILGIARTVTITGPGGVGKTRLAVELAHIVAGESGRSRGTVSRGTVSRAISTGSIMSRSASWRPWRAATRSSPRSPPRSASSRGPRSHSSRGSSRRCAGGACSWCSTTAST